MSKESSHASDLDLAAKYRGRLLLSGQGTCHLPFFVPASEEIPSESNPLSTENPLAPNPLGPKSFGFSTFYPFTPTSTSTDSFNVNRHPQNTWYSERHLQQRQGSLTAKGLRAVNFLTFRETTSGAFHGAQLTVSCCPSVFLLKRQRHPDLPCRSPSIKSPLSSSDLTGFEGTPVKRSLVCYGRHHL